MKAPYLLLDDVEDFFVAASETNADLPDTGDPAPALPINPFQATDRFICTFANGDNRGACLNHLVTLHRGMRPRKEISDAD